MVELEDLIMTISINVNNYDYKEDSSLYICNEVCNVNDPANINERIIFNNKFHLREELLRYGILKLIKKYCSKRVMKEIKREGSFYYDGFLIAYKETQFKPEGKNCNER